MRRLLLCVALMAIPLVGDEPPAAKPPGPPETIESLRAEVEFLRVQLSKLLSDSTFELRICNGALSAAREFVTRKPHPFIGSPSQKK